jgi:hypothetical protein
MAQAGYTPIQLYFSTTAAAVPTSGNLANGELGINITDEKLYFKNAAGVVKLLASNAGSTGTVSSVAQSFTGGLISVAGSPITTSGTLALTVAGTSGGIPYFSSGTTWASSAALAANSLVIGGGAGAAPSTTTTGTGVVTALGVNVGTAGAFVVNGGALGTPSSGTVTNLTGTASININGTVGATTPTTGAFTTVTENGYAVVSQADIGTADNEIPLNQYLGSMAYQNGTDYYNTGMTVGFRNRIINGDMRIDQRNAGAAIASPSDNYTTDRFYSRQVGGGVASAQQSSTAPTGFTNSLLFTVTTADSSIVTTDRYYVAQFIEGYNIADLAFGTASASSITLSFWVRSSLTGTFGGAIRNSGASRSYPFTYTINAANTFEQKTITIAGDTSGTWLTTNGTGIQVIFSIGMGPTYSETAGAWAAGDYLSATGATNVIATNGATWYITGVQLEKGTQATPFDWRPYTTELQLCQRYFYKADPITIPCFATTTTRALGTIAFPTTMRATPTSSGTDVTSMNNWYVANLTGVYSYETGGLTANGNGVGYSVTSGTNYTAGTIYRPNGSAGSFSISYTAEL